MNSGEIIQAIGAGFGWGWASSTVFLWLKARAGRADLRRAEIIADDLRGQISARVISDPEAVGIDMINRRKEHRLAVLALAPAKDTALLARMSFVAPDLMTGRREDLLAWSNSQRGPALVRAAQFVRSAIRG